MTSRHKNVLSDEMGARVNFPLGVLPGNEAWNLFEKTVGDCVKNTELKSVAGEVAKRCGGLPLSLIPVARALKDRTLSYWKDALEQLKRFDNSDDIVIKAFSALKLSYSSLPNAETKLLFLLCGQFQHRGSIATRDLLKYSMGLDLFKRSTVEDVRNRLHRFLDILESSCLLQKGDLVEEVVMHDAVHEFAKKVASGEHGVFTAAGDDNALLQWPAKDTLEQCTAISLRCRKIPELPETFDWPKLRSFLLYSDDPLQTIPENLFTGMKELRVLAMRGMQLSPLLPSSLQLLQNLQTLCLDGCDLKNVAIIGKLKALKVLSFMGSSITQLPGEISQLSQLQLLDLSKCTRLEVIPPNVLSCLTELEDLYMANTFQQWELEGQHNQRNNASLAELKHLSNLITLHICVDDGKLFPNDLLFEKLERFRIAIGYEWTWFDKCETSRTLKLMHNINPLKKGVELLLKKAEDLYLEELEGVKNALTELNGEGFPLLKHLHVKSSPGIQYIVDLIMMRPSSAFPLLEELSLDNLNKLEKICHGPDIPKSFSNLRILKVEICHKLKNLFSFSMATSLLRLEETVIRDCKMLEVIFAEETEGEADKAEVIKFSQLRTLTLESVPHFTSICSKVNPPSTSRTSRNLLTTNAGPQDIVAENEPQTPVPLFKRKIEFSNLRDLKLSSIKVEKIWHEQPIDLSSCVQNLTSLTVEGCGGLKYLFTSSMVIAFANLRKLQVCDCQVMKEVVTLKELGDGEIMSEMLFPKLEYLELEGLPKLIRFCNGNFIKYPSLKDLGIKNCPEMKEFISSTFVHENAAGNREPEETNSSLFNGKIEFPNLEVLKLSSIKVEKIWDDQHLDPSCSVQKLTSLTVDGCGSLKYLFTSFIVESLVELKKLEISECKSMEAVMVRKGLEDGQFPNLDVLKLKDLPKLARFCTDVAANCEYEERNSTLFDEKVAFPNLERLSVFGMKNLEMIWHKQLRLDSFCKLKELYITKGERILNIFPSNMLRRFQKLEHLDVTDCASLEEVFDIESLMHEKETHAVTTSQLRTMHIMNLPRLKNVWNGTPIGILSFENLRKVIVWDCPHLKYLFPVSIALELLQLEALNVVRNGMEGIVAEEEGLKVAPKFVFPKVTSVTLWNLRGLHCFYPGQHTLDWPILKALRVYRCNKAMMFDLDIESFQGSSVVEQPEIQLPLFSFKKIVPNLETLSLNGNDATMIRQGQFPAELFHKLKSLELQCFRDGEQDLLLDLLQKCQNMKKLIVFDSFRLGELFPCRIVGEEECATTLARIRYLEIRSMYNLVRIWSQDFQMDQIQNLETLQVSFCRSLISLAPSTASFKNLTSLDVWKCEGLVYLVSSSTAKSLAQLIKMRVEQCDMMTEVVANRGDEAEYKITFKKLRSLKLDCLPSLTSFCSENCSFVFPSLIEVLVKGCPRMKFFSKGILSTPKLREVKLMKKENKGHWDGDLNNTIQRLLPLSEMAGFRGLEVLKLSDFPELQDTWHAELRGELFSDLKSLVVEDCASFPSAVSSNLLMFLNNLENLAVRDCESLEEVFDLQGLDSDKGHDGLLSMLEQLSLICLPRLVHLWTGFSRGVLDLKGLKVLKVHNCISLRNIFIPSMASVLSQLQDLNVCSCPNIEEIITEGSSGQVEIEKIIFPRLRSIALASLPKLTRFYCGRGAVECPSLEVIRVIDCLSAFSSSTFLKKQEPNPTDSKVVFPSLEQLTLSSIKVKKIWYDQPADPYSCIRNLTFLVVEGCGKLKYIFTPSMVESLAQLKKLAIRNCILLEEIIITEGEIGSKMLFRKLEVLKLKGLPKVTKFCKTETNTFVFNSTIGVDAAGSKKTISTLFDEKVAFPELKRLVLFNMDGLEMIWHDELLPNSFGKLKNLNVRHGNKLFRIFPSSMLRRLKNLEVLFIIDCDLVEEVFNLQGPINEKGRHGATVIGLRKIHLRKLRNLKNVWNGNPRGILSFQKLCLVRVLDCPNLNSIFPASVALDLSKLETLVIRSCGVEEIVSEEEGVEAVNFVFPRATELYLKDLPELKRLYPRMHTSKWPAIKELVVELCDKIPIFDLEIQSFEGPLFSFKEIMITLEQLTLTSKHATMIRNDQFPSDHFDKLNSLALTHDGSADFPFDIFQRFQNMKSLRIAGRELKELFSSGLVGDAENTRTLARIQRLYLHYLYDLEHIWIEDFPVDEIFPSLETLRVYRCNSLVNLAPATASFGQLKSLTVDNCKGLKYIITSSTARGLVQLTDMTVAECDMLTEIVASEKDEGENEIVFKKLGSLKLKDLASLTNFCSANFSLKFPSLTYVAVAECPKMKTFSYGVIRTPVLEAVCVSAVMDEKQWKGDLNNTIMHMNTGEGSQDSEEEDAE